MTQPLGDRDEFLWMEEQPPENTLEVAPGIYQSQEDYKANMAYDESRDNEVY